MTPFSPPNGPNRWPEFTATRAGLLRQLAEPVLAGIARFDTEHPVFHGCVDWHSAVHATYALLAAGRLTADHHLTAAGLAPAQDAARMRAEEAALRDGQLEHEIPYGLAWTLILDVEAARSHIDVFSGLAQLAHDRLIEHLEQHITRQTLAAAALDEEYDNVLWAALALLRWTSIRAPASRTPASRSQASRTRAIRVARAALDAVLAQSETASHAPVGFFSPPHLALLLAAELQIGTADLGQLLDVVATTPLLAADAMVTVHAAGINFSRAWGAYAGWRIAGTDAFRECFAALLLGHLAMPDRWIEDYRRYSHWIPQFGIFAIAETFDHP